jgi:plastocyanin
MRFTLRKTLIAGIAGTLALASTAVFAVDHPVTVGGAAGLAFTPQFITINAGDTVTFTNAGGFHNVASDPGAVTSFHCSTACGASPTGDPNGALWSQQITFPTPGTAGYHCEAHGAPGQNMFGTITVNPVPVELQSFDVD